MLIEKLIDRLKCSAFITSGNRLGLAGYPGPGENVGRKDTLSRWSRGLELLGFKPQNLNTGILVIGCHESVVRSQFEDIKSLCGFNDPQGKEKP